LQARWGLAFFPAQKMSFWGIDGIDGGKPALGGLVGSG